MPCRVLVVDDQVETAEGLAELLRLWGHVVDVAHDGPEALVAAERGSPDVVLLDISLPEMDGYEVARRLRARSGGERVVLVALTGHDADEHHLRATASDFDHHLQKPLGFESLEAILAKVPDACVSR